MAGFNGRAFTFDWDSTTLAGVRTRGLSITNDYVDVTTDDDTGWRTLLATPGLRSIEVTIGGIATDEAVLADIMAANVAAATLQADLPSSLASPGNLSGSYLISSFEMSGDHDGAVEFSVTFMSTGAVTYTASSA
jgi:TP901-1 family phage major tail protein